MTSETRANLQEQIRLLIATQPTSSASRAAEYLQTLIDGMELSSIPIQKSELKALKCLLTASAIVPQVVQAPTDDEPLSWPDEVAHLLKMQVAAPIVATVPSEHQLWNAACAIRELEFEDVPLPDCMVLIHEILDPYLAAPSPTEQASDVRNAAYERAATVIELYDDATMQDDYMLSADECAGIIRALKSATHADKGNAPVGAKS